MPAKLDRCVKKVMAKGRAKSSAFGICTVSLGLGKARKSGEETMGAVKNNPTGFAGKGFTTRIPFGGSSLQRRTGGS